MKLLHCNRNKLATNAVISLQLMLQSLLDEWKVLGWYSNTRVRNQECKQVDIGFDVRVNKFEKM